MSFLGMLLLGLAVAALLVFPLGACKARIIVSDRNRERSNPRREGGLALEDAGSRSQDGVPLEGWFVSAAGPGPAMVFLRGWPRYRGGTRHASAPDDLPGSKPVHLMRLAHAHLGGGSDVFVVGLRVFGVGFLGGSHAVIPARANRRESCTRTVQQRASLRFFREHLDRSPPAPAPTSRAARLHA